MATLTVPADNAPLSIDLLIVGGGGGGASRHGGGGGAGACESIRQVMEHQLEPPITIGAGGNGLE